MHRSTLHVLAVQVQEGVARAMEELFPKHDEAGFQPEELVDLAAEAVATDRSERAKAKAAEKKIPSRPPPLKPTSKAPAMLKAKQEELGKGKTCEMSLLTFGRSSLWKLAEIMMKTKTLPPWIDNEMNRIMGSQWFLL